MKCDICGSEEHLLCLKHLLINKFPRKYKPLAYCHKPECQDKAREQALKCDSCKCCLDAKHDWYYVGKKTGRITCYDCSQRRR